MILAKLKSIEELKEAGYQEGIQDGEEAYIKSYYITFTTYEALKNKVLLLEKRDRDFKNIGNIDWYFKKDSLTFIDSKLVKVLYS